MACEESDIERSNDHPGGLALRWFIVQPATKIVASAINAMIGRYMTHSFPVGVESPPIGFGST
jgi:hypothetical protein